MSDTAGADDGQSTPAPASGPGGPAPDAGSPAGTDKGGNQGSARGGKGPAGSEAGDKGGPAAGRDDDRQPVHKDDDAGDEYTRGQKELAAERARLNPLGVPDKFLDKSGRPDFAKLTKSYKEADSALMRKHSEVRAEIERSFHDERSRAAPATPADYRVEEKFVLGDRTIQMITDDPMLNWAREVAHANHWTQQQFDENVRGYVARQIGSLPKWSAEAEKLGPNADARHSRVDGFLRGNLSEQTYQTFATMPATASLITAIEEVMELAGHPKITDDTTAIPRETLGRDQLTQMQSDPRYTGEKGRIDPGFVARVRAGYRALNKNGAGR
jgi:hypothetical protein